MRALICLRVLANADTTESFESNVLAPDATVKCLTASPPMSGYAQNARNE